MDKLKKPKPEEYKKDKSGWDKLIAQAAFVEAERSYYQALAARYREALDKIGAGEFDLRNGTQAMDIANEALSSVEE
jgi:hypothetical protein